MKHVTKPYLSEGEKFKFFTCIRVHRWKDSNANVCPIWVGPLRNKELITPTGILQLTEKGKRIARQLGASIPG